MGPSDGVTAETPSDTGHERRDGADAPISAVDHPPSIAFGLPTPGHDFGTRYQIIKMLGAGGMGAVYQAWDRDLGVTVALKVIRLDVVGSAAAAHNLEQRFKRELLLARQVTHKNVVRIHDMGEIAGVRYLTMPFLQGADLATVLSGMRKLAVAPALKIARQIVSGLQAAHEAGVVHRDLKPANIMIEDDHAILMDFGIARSNETLSARAASRSTRPAFGGPSLETRVGSVVGTLKYMAPEQGRGEAVDHRADIYAFGLILRDMLLGDRQTSGSETWQTDLQRRMEQAPAPARSIDATIPEALDRVISRCLQPDPAARYQSATELAAALDRLDEHGHPLPVLRTIRLPFVVAGGALAASLIAAALWFGRSSAPPVQPDPISILIAEFANRTGDSVFDGVVEQALGVALETAPFISAYSTRDARNVAAQLGAGPQLDESVARLVAGREGIQIVISGEIEQVGNGHRLSAQVVDPATGTVVGTANATARGRDRVPEAIGALANDLRTALGDTTPESTRTIGAETFTAQSLEASRAYAQGQEALWAGEPEKAIQQYSEAVRLDPALGRAYAGLATIHANLGRRSEAQQYYELALARLNRMSEREKFRTRIAYFLFIRNSDQAIGELQSLVTSFPADTAGLANLALAYFYKRDMARAVEEGRRATELLPKNVIRRNNLALYGLYASDFALAEREAAEALKVNPSYVKAFVATALAQLAQGRPDDAARTYEKLRAVSPSGASYSATGLADLAIHEGRVRDAIPILEQGIAGDMAEQNTTAAAFKQVMLADSLRALGRIRQARSALDEALKRSRDDSVVIAAGRAYIAAGQADKALALARELQARIEPDPQAYGSLIEGEAALARGDARAALLFFETAKKQADTWLGRFDLGRAHVALNRFAEASSELENALKRRGEAAALFLDDVPTFAAFPAVHYYLGRVQQGLNSPSAVESYRTFLALKQKADPKLDPLVADAMAHLNP